MNQELKELYLNGILTYLTNVKKEIEAEGLIPTIDEAITRVKILLTTDHDCHASEEDGCEICDMSHEEYNDFVHNKADEEADRLHDESKEE